MSSVAAIETTAPETASCSGVSRPFGDLRGVRWRIDLGILPPSASVDDLRRVTANSRRRYAALRRQLLVDPHVPKDGSNSPDPVMDNPLSQNPDSMWGRFFKNAELERMVDQDLTRLYPERGSYFQTSGCQGMLRRILLLWCLRHPEYGYRQGMHELLAPLLYVLQVDVERLSEVRKNYDDYFADKFDGFSFHENDLTYKFDFKKFSDSEEEWNGFEKNSVKASSLSDLDSEIQTIVFLSDAYGAEGELGIVLSEKFLEHDAYSMFDALMSGAGGAVSMAEFFCPSPFKSTNTGFPPVIEASAALYHLLSVVDLSLHSHLVELGVEPQYFALRWLRVLFGREFSLEDLLVIWDEIFAHENTKNSKAVESDAETNFGVLESPRGAFISAFAVSMILSLRSSLLATEHATACLQRLLNFPVDIDLAKLVAKAKSLQDLAVDANSSITQPIHPWSKDGKKSGHTRAHSLSLDPTSPRSLLGMVPESYWEEKWRVLHKEEEHKQGAVEEQVPIRKKGWSERVKLRLSRTESDPSPSSIIGKTKTPKPSVRRSLLDDLAQQLGSNEDKHDAGSVEDVNHQERVEVSGQDFNGENFGNSSHGVGSEDNSSNFSDPSSPIHGKKDQEFISGRSSVASNSSIDENDAEVCGTNQEDGHAKLCETTLGDRNAKLSGTNQEEGKAKVCGTTLEDRNAESSGTHQESPHLPVSDQPEGLSPKVTQNDDSDGKLNVGMKERKLLSGKFQWLWKFGRNVNEGVSETTGAPEDAKACSDASGQSNLAGIHAGNGCEGSSGTSKGETVDQNLMVTLRHLGQSMLENIQVIESAFQQERGLTGTLENSKNGFVGKGQVTAMSAIKELRKISNLLSEM